MCPGAVLQLSLIDWIKRELAFRLWPSLGLVGAPDAGRAAVLSLAKAERQAAVVESFQGADYLRARASVRWRRGLRVRAKLARCARACRVGFREYCGRGCNRW